MTALSVKLPPLYAQQRDAFYNDARYSICEASTKGGKTAGALVWQMGRCLSDKLQRHHWWLAPVYGQAAIGFTRAKRMCAELIADNRARAVGDPMRIEFDNGSTWWFKSAEKPDNLYGEDVADAVLDEFTRMREEAWWAIRSTLTATQGQVRMIGNVKGRGNWGFKMARKAQAGEPGCVYHRITADDAIRAGIIRQAEVDDAERILPHHIFRELYYCEPSDDGGNPFGIAAIEACIGPMSDLEPVAWGVDLAKSQDWTVAIGVDENCDVCRFERWQGVPWPETTERVAGMVGNVPSLMDSTGVGDPIVEAIQGQCPNVEGFKFTSASKQQIMEGLAQSIQGGEVGYPDGPIRNELDCFEYAHTRTGVRYEASAGCHDDCVDSLALAVEMFRRLGRFVPAGASITGRANTEYAEQDAKQTFARLRQDDDWGF